MNGFGFEFNIWLAVPKEGLVLQGLIVSRPQIQRRRLL
jgi:hypothetical protein